MKDRVIQRLIEQEERRQDDVINLIASENYTSDDVREALSSVFVNKYAEGYPGKRYYAGLDVVDKLEQEVKKRALDVFGVGNNTWNVNVQALSGSPAMLAALFATTPLKGKVMALSLDSGGHLSHGYTLSLTGKLWNQIPYEVSKSNHRLSRKELEQVVAKEKPDTIIAGFSAYPRKVPWSTFKSLAKQVGATFIADISHISGLVAGGAHTSPFRYADVVVTTTHKTLRGPRGALIFSRKDNRKLGRKIDRAVFPGIQGGPHIHKMAAVGVALREASLASFSKYAHQTVLNAQAMSERFNELGWKVITGGTDTHLLLLDVYETLGIGGDDAQSILEKEGIIVNKNMIPFDERSPLDPSGIRIGTPAMTTRGKKEGHFRRYASTIDELLRNVAQK